MSESNRSGLFERATAHSFRRRPQSLVATAPTPANATPAGSGTVATVRLADVVCRSELGLKTICSIPGAIAMPALTQAQLDILKLVSSFNGQYGPNSIEAAMNELSGLPESEWSPVRDQLDSLEDLGLIRPEVTEVGHGRYWITDRGRKLVDSGGGANG